MITINVLNTYSYKRTVMFEAFQLGGRMNFILRSRSSPLDIKHNIEFHWNQALGAFLNAANPHHCKLSNDLCLHKLFVKVKRAV